jgi:hypothetical protein
MKVGNEMICWSTIMENLLAKTIFSISSLLKRIQTKRFWVVVLGGILLLTTNVGFGHRTSEALGETVQEPLDSGKMKLVKRKVIQVNDYGELRKNPAKPLKNLEQDMWKVARRLLVMYETV